MNRTAFLLLGALSLVGFPLIGIAIIYIFQDRSILEILVEGWNPVLQVGIGLGYGVAVGLAVHWLIRLQWMRPIRNQYIRLFQSLKFNIADILYISICAAVGEEILFRAAIQPLWGIWLTSIVFVAIHGYIDPRSWRMTVYGAYTILAVAGMGWLFEHLGLYTAVAAHFALDVVILWDMRSSKPHSVTV